MKKYSTILFLLLINHFFAQAPQKMSYQAVLRNANNDLITNTTVGMRISILQGSTSGISVYVETQNPTTNANGLVSLEIGSGTPVTGTFATINWANGPFYIKTETAPSGGTNYTITGTNQLLSVPYALYAENSKQQGKTTIILADDITDAQAAAQISKELGPNTENIIIRNTTQLTSVDFSGATSMINISIINNSALSSINFSTLTKLYGDIIIEFNSALSSILFNNLTVVSGNIVTVSNSNLQSVSFNSISRSANINIAENINLQSVSFNSLTNSGDIFISDNSDVISITFPSLISCRHIIMNRNLNLNSISLPVLSICSGYYFDVSNNSLTSINISSLSNNNDFFIGGNRLSSSTVNALLNKFLTISPLSGKNLLLDGQNPPAPPTGQGIIDKATLINLGNTVITD